MYNKQERYRHADSVVLLPALLATLPVAAQESMKENAFVLSAGDKQLPW